MVDNLPLDVVGDLVDFLPAVGVGHRQAIRPHERRQGSQLIGFQPGVEHQGEGPDPGGPHKTKLHKRLSRLVLLADPEVGRAVGAGIAIDENAAAIGLLFREHMGKIQLMFRPVRMAVMLIDEILPAGQPLPRDGSGRGVGGGGDLQRRLVLQQQVQLAVRSNGGIDRQRDRAAVSRVHLDFPVGQMEVGQIVFRPAARPDRIGQGYGGGGGVGELQLDRRQAGCLHRQTQQVFPIQCRGFPRGQAGKIGTGGGGDLHLLRIKGEGFAGPQEGLVVPQQLLPQPIDQIGASRQLSRRYVVLPAQDGGGAHRLPNAPARSHDAGRAEGDVRHAHVPPRQEQVVEIGGDRAAQRNFIHTGHVVKAAGRARIMYPQRRVYIHRPAAHRDPVGESGFLLDVGLGQHILPADPPGFPLACNGGHVGQLQVLHVGKCAAVFDVIPQAVDQPIQLEADGGVIPDDMPVVAAAFDPPDGVKFTPGPPDGPAAPLSAQVIEEGKGGDIVGKIRPFIGEGAVRPAAVKDQGIAHGAVVRLGRRIGFAEGVGSFPAVEKARSRLGGYRAVAGRVHKQRAFKAEMRFRAQLDAVHGPNLPRRRVRLLYDGVQIQPDVGFPAHQIQKSGAAHRIGGTHPVGRIAVGAYLQLQLLHQASLAGIHRGGASPRTAGRAGDGDPQLAAGHAAEHRPVVDQRYRQTPAGRRHGGTDSGHTAADHRQVGPDHRFSVHEAPSRFSLSGGQLVVFVQHDGDGAGFPPLHMTDDRPRLPHPVDRQLAHGGPFPGGIEDLDGVCTAPQPPPDGDMLPVPGQAGLHQQPFPHGAYPQ